MFLNKKSKKKEQECEYEVIRTSDGANMAIKLLVQFKMNLNYIYSPERVFSLLFYT